MTTIRGPREPILRTDPNAQRPAAAPTPLPTRPVDTRPVDTRPVTPAVAPALAQRTAAHPHPHDHSHAPVELAAVEAPAEGARVVNGVEIRAHGASEVAVREAESVVKALTYRTDVAQALQRKNTTLVIIPADRKMTDLPEFASLRGKHTFDGRPWEDVRGSGGMRGPGGRWVVAVGEENLAELASDTYQGNFSAGIHELAHTVHSVGITNPERAEITRLYNERKLHGGVFTDAYAASNEHEYFAQATNAYFGRNEGQGKNGAGWLAQHDPGMYALMERIYGPPPQLAVS